MFQDIDGQLINAVVEDEMFFGLENFGVPKAEAESRVREALEQTGIAELRRRDINTLSGGQKQKVAIASVLALRPRILLLDEPTGELDPASSRTIFALLRRLNRDSGMTVVIVEQKIMLLCEFVSELAVMSDGRLEFFGPVRRVLERAGELEKMGVNCPRVVTLYNALREKGMVAAGEDTGGNPRLGVCVNVDEAEELIGKILS